MIKKESIFIVLKAPRFHHCASYFHRYIASFSAITVNNLQRVVLTITYCFLQVTGFEKLCYIG